jgi:hypothetical protein
MSNFEFTNDKNNFIAVFAFRDDAIADGWAAKPTYCSESLDRATTLEKDNFIIQVISRIDDEKYKADISIWGSDGLSISLLGPKYNFEDIKSGLFRCDNCKAQNVKIKRHSFVGRCCEKCYPEMIKKYEFLGWTN